MLYVNMRCQFILSTEGHIALGLALLIRAHKVSYRKVSLQCLISFVVHVLVVFAAQMTCQVLPVQMINEDQLIKEVFFAEIAPGVWEYLRLPVRSRIPLLDMLFQLLVNIV